MVSITVSHTRNITHTARRTMGFRSAYSSFPGQREQPGLGIGRKHARRRARRWEQTARGVRPAATTCRRCHHTNAPNQRGLPIPHEVVGVCANCYNAFGALKLQRSQRHFQTLVDILRAEVLEHIPVEKRTHIGDEGNVVSTIQCTRKRTPVSSRLRRVRAGVYDPLCEAHRHMSQFQPNIQTPSLLSVRTSVQCEHEALA